MEFRRRLVQGAEACEASVKRIANFVCAEACGSSELRFHFLQASEMSNKMNDFIGSSKFFLFAPHP